LDDAPRNTLVIWLSLYFRIYSKDISHKHYIIPILFLDDGKGFRIVQNVSRQKTNEFDVVE